VRLPFRHTGNTEHAGTNIRGRPLTKPRRFIARLAAARRCAIRLVFQQRQDAQHYQRLAKRVALLRQPVQVKQTVGYRLRHCRH
jgi:hypothetical protein